MNYHSIGNSIKSSETFVDEGVFHVLLLLLLNPFTPMQNRFATTYYCLINRLDLLVSPTIWNIDCLQIAGRNFPLLNEEEFQNNIMKTVFHMKIRQDYESKLGDVIYTFALYKRVKRASILLNHSDLGSGRLVPSSNINMFVVVLLFSSIISNNSTLQRS
jgi:hypothetical protein